MFELLFIIAGFLVIVFNGPLWLALGGIWYFGDGDFDWF